MAQRYERNNRLSEWGCSQQGELSFEALHDRTPPSYSFPTSWAMSKEWKRLRWEYGSSCFPYLAASNLSSQATKSSDVAKELEGMKVGHASTARLLRWKGVSKN